MQVILAFYHEIEITVRDLQSDLDLPCSGPLFQFRKDPSELAFKVPENLNYSLMVFSYERSKDGYHINNHHNRGWPEYLGNNES